MKREIFVRTIPANLRNPASNGKTPEKIGIRELLMAEEEEAAESASTQAKLPYAMLRKSACWVKYEEEDIGHEFNYKEAEDHVVFDSLKSAARALLMRAFNELHTPNKEAQDNFLGSLEVI